MLEDEIFEEKPCKYQLGYKDGDKVNGVKCNEYDFSTKCPTCGFNPSVAHTRLANRFGDKKATELMQLSLKLSKEYRKEHVLL